jgi:hypothetical protein
VSFHIRRIARQESECFRKSAIPNFLGDIAMRDQFPPFGRLDSPRKGPQIRLAPLHLLIIHLAASLFTPSTARA